MNSSDLDGGASNLKEAVLAEIDRFGSPEECAVLESADIAMMRAASYDEEEEDMDDDDSGSDGSYMMLERSMPNRGGGGAMRSRAMPERRVMMQQAMPMAMQSHQMNQIQE